MDTAAPINLRYEDIALGMQFESAPHTVTPADIATFADVTRDHHPLHVDAAYAKSRGFPAVIAHGLYSLSLMEGLKSELKLYEETSVASLGWLDLVNQRDEVVTEARHTSLILTRQPDYKSSMRDAT